MQKSLNALIFEENGWQIAQCIEIDVASQGNTRAEALANLQEAISLHLLAPSSNILGSFAHSIAEAQTILPDSILASWSLQDEHQQSEPGLGKTTERLVDNLSFRKIRFKLEEAGFDEVKQLGNHAKFVRRSDSIVATVILPHYKEISASILSSVLKQAGLSKQEFDKL